LQNTYREKVGFSVGFQKYVIKGKKGTSIYKDRRPNHTKGMIRLVESEPIEELTDFNPQGNPLKEMNRFTQGIAVEEETLVEYDYLLFDIQNDIDRNSFEDQIELNQVHIQQFHYLTEVACYHPQVFTSGVLNVLQELGYIKLIVKEFPNEAGLYPMYLNPKGWMHIYNFFSIIRQGVFSLRSGVLYRNTKSNEKEAEE
jgi:hypothetical protein